jgi:hypothetical protein
VIKNNLFTLCIGCVLLLALGVVANRVYKRYMTTTIEIRMDKFECTDTVREAKGHLVGKVPVVTYDTVCINYKRIGK